MKAKKFVVTANVAGFGFRPEYFASRNAAYRFARVQYAWHGGEFFVNGKRKFTEGV